MTRKRHQDPVFSSEMEQWLASKQDKTLAGLTQLFAEKSFAVMFVLLMALPALPLPTGGLTHVFELIVALLCLEIILGRQTIWLPQRWLKIDVGNLLKGKAATKFINLIKWFERFSRHRGSYLLKQRGVTILMGLVILLFTVAAFIAPPFSGLDTLPALGVVVISLAIILEDIVLVIFGTVIGLVGIGLEIAAGTALYSGLTHFF